VCFSSVEAKGFFVLGGTCFAGKEGGRGIPLPSKLATEIQKTREKAMSQIEQAMSPAELEEIRVKFLGKKGEVTGLLKTIGSLPKDERPVFGASVNSLREELEASLADRREELERIALEEEMAQDAIDVTLPGQQMITGSLHPLTAATRELLDVFYGMGFTVFESREAETDDINFVKLNLAPGHPARDMQDSLYLSESVVMRTHTSPGQIRGMWEMKGELPVRFVVPGRVYRRDPADASHQPVFHQIEGLAIDTDINLGHLRGVLMEFARKFFGKRLDVRLRPSYFPFTEPSAEVDIACPFCGGNGCTTCGNGGWLEIAGAGMVHPRVLSNGGYDPGRVTGFAFGMGLDRIAMLKYGIDDMRMLYANDQRFLNQFRGL
jgi:phenylalanyl-tRNA synthetase alpha chain